jgi:hypothetical protein
MKFLPYFNIKFAHLIEGNFEYVDKTYYVYQLLRSAGQYTLTRPSNFGKSLLLDALEAAWRGQRELFNGLWLDQSDYEWPTFPVLRLNFSSVMNDNIEELNNSLLGILKPIANNEDLSIESKDPIQFFQLIIESLYQKYNKTPVVTLIDDYDKALYDEWYQIEMPLKVIRQRLGNFFNVLNLTERYRGFTLLVGQTRFSANSNYPGLRGLVDLSLDPRYANCCGFTLEEFDALVAERLEQDLDEFKACGEIGQAATPADLRDKILAWQDGYSWDGRTRLLKPRSLFKVLTSKCFDDYGVKSLKSTLLGRFLKKKKSLFLRCFVKDNFIDPTTNEFNPQAWRLEPLLFQGGFMTCRSDASPTDLKFNLVFPNLESKWSLAAEILSLELPLIDPLILRAQARAVLTSLFQKDPAKFSETLAFFLDNFELALKSPVKSLVARIFIMAATLADLVFEPESSARGHLLDLRLRDPETKVVYFLDFDILGERSDQASLAQRSLVRLNQRIFRLKNPIEKKWLAPTTVLVNSAGQVTTSFGSVAALLEPKTGVNPEKISRKK